MKRSTENPVPLSNPDIEMNESTINPWTVPQFNPDSEDEYQEVLEECLVPNDVDMDNRESGTSDMAVSFPFTYRSSDNPLPRRASNNQEPRNKDNDSTSHPKSIMPAPQQNSTAASGTIHFHRDPDGPLFNTGSKRRALEEDEENRNENEKRKNPMRVNVRAIQLCDEFEC